MSSRSCSLLFCLSRYRFCAVRFAVRLRSFLRAQAEHRFKTQFASTTPRSRSRSAFEPNAQHLLALFSRLRLELVALHMFENRRSRATATKRGLQSRAVAFRLIRF